MQMPFDSARMDALAKRIQLLKGLNPTKLISPSPVAQMTAEGFYGKGCKPDSEVATKIVEICPTPGVFPRCEGKDAGVRRILEDDEESEEDDKEKEESKSEEEPPCPLACERSVTKDSQLGLVENREEQLGVLTKSSGLEHHVLDEMSSLISQENEDEGDSDGDPPFDGPESGDLGENSTSSEDNNEKAEICAGAALTQVCLSTPIDEHCGSVSLVPTCKISGECKQPGFNEDTFGNAIEVFDEWHEPVIKPTGFEKGKESLLVAECNLGPNLGPKEAKEDTEDFSFEDYVAADHPMAMDALRFMASLFDDFLLQAQSSLLSYQIGLSLFWSNIAVLFFGKLISFLKTSWDFLSNESELQLLLTKVKTKSPDLDGGDLGLKEKSDKRVPKLEAGQKEEDTVISEMNERIAPPSLMFRSSMNSYRIDLDSGSGEEGEEGISNNIVEKEVDEEEEAIGASRNKGNIETGVAVQAKSNTEVGDEWSFTRLCAVWYRSCC
ncbi:hypothetical protein U1Q18_037848 [Sarracenia purpurea var. burkii]